MSTPTIAADVASRQAPGLGGFNLTVLKLEVRRLTRNRRTIIIAVVVPIALFLIFGLNRSFDTTQVGHGNLSAFVMVSVALYGAVLATTFAGALVSMERAQGWSRQLRLTPLTPVAYIAIKVATALVLGATSVAAVYIVGAITNKASMSVGLWIATGFSVWIGSLLFAAFGLFIGYVLPAENVMQLLGLIIGLLSFAGGLFIPISQFATAVQDVLKWSPLYGLNELVHTPLIGNGVDWTWVVNVLGWLIIFSAGAMWRFRKDTARV
ncbi:MAG: ABC transporter permease [Streptosporangiaceae bacterium]